MSGTALALPLSSNVNGRTWHLYSFDYESPDGRGSGYFYATSHDHAALLLSELKESAVLSHQVIGQIDE
jgi:hypothetical protein